MHSGFSKKDSRDHKATLQPKAIHVQKSINRMIIFRLKQARTMSGMTLREAAKGLGMTFQYLDKIEKTGCKMNSEKLIKFANFYNVTVDYLIPNKNRPPVELTNIKVFCKSKY
jgi:DNA-binding XRE family transcriptional regulator